jgi:hypothetical protein
MSPRLVRVIATPELDRVLARAPAVATGVDRDREITSAARTCDRPMTFAVL